MKPIMADHERLLIPEEVATLFRVEPKTVTRWAASGRIRSIRTPGGHRRFRMSAVQALLADETTEAENSAPGGETRQSSENQSQAERPSLLLADGPSPHQVAEGVSA